jgi:hypothetical protein
MKSDNESVSRDRETDAGCGSRLGVCAPVALRLQAGRMNENRHEPNSEAGE